MALEKLGVQAVVEGLSRFTRDLKKMDKSIEDVGDATTKTEKISTGLAQNWTNLATVAASLGAAVFAAKKYFDFAEEGAQLLRLEQAGESLASSFGISMDKVVDAVDKAAKGTVARTDIIQAANRAMLLGVADSAEEMARLMEVAAVRGKAMGLSTTQAFNDIVTGIGRASPMILDNLGIVTGGEAVYVRFAESIGKTKDELTDAEKKQALVNIVIEDSIPLLDAASDSTDDLATSYEQFNAAVKDAENSFKEFLALTLGTEVKNMAKLLRTNLDISDVMEKYDLHRDLFKGFVDESGKVIARNWRELVKWAESMREAEEAESQKIEADLEHLRIAREKLDANELESISLEELTQRNKELAEEEEKLAQIAIEEKYRNLKDLMKVDLTEAFVDFKTKVQDLAGEISILEGLDMLTDEQKTQLEESREELDKTIKKWREYTAQVIFNIAAQALEREGLTEEEAIALAKSAEGLGLVDEGYAALTESIYESADSMDATGDQSDEFVEAMMRLVDALSDATIEADNLDEAIRNIPTTKEIELITTYKIHGAPIIPRQHGGAVQRGLPYLVGERGPELFIPSISGNVLSNMMSKAIGQIGASMNSTQTNYGDNLNLHIHTSAPTEDIMTDFRIMKAMGSRV